MNFRLLLLNILLLSTFVFGQDGSGRDVFIDSVFSTSSGSGTKLSDYTVGLKTKDYADSSVTSAKLTDRTVNVLNYGSTSTAINSAIATGVKNIFIPDGIYSITSPVAITEDDIHISGGKNAVFNVTGAISAITITGSDNVKIDNIKIKGNYTSTQYGITHTLASNVNIVNCKFDSLDRGVNFVSNATANYYGIVVDKPSKVSNCVFDTCLTGVYIGAGSEYVKVENNDFIKCSSYGIRTKAGNSVINGNRLNGNDVGIWIDGQSSGGNSDHGQIVGNQINHNQKAGIYLSSLKYSYHITGNDIWANIGPDSLPVANAPDSAGFGIYAVGADNLNITGNSISRNRVNIGLDGWTNGLIADNHFLGDVNRTVNNILEMGSNSAKFGQLNSHNIITNNIFSGGVKSGGVSVSLLRTTGTQATLIKDNKGTTKRTYEWINSADNGSNYYYDGTVDYLLFQDSFTDSLIIPPSRRQVGFDMCFLRSSGNMVVYFKDAYQLFSYNSGVTTNNTDEATFERDGVYTVIPFGDSSWAIFGAPDDRQVWDGSRTKDDYYDGNVIKGINAGENLTQWDAVYIDSVGASNTWKKADNDATGKSPAIGITTTAVTSGNEATVLVNGTVRNAGWGWGDNAGKYLYLSSTAGQITDTKPTGSGETIQIMGWTLSGGDIFVSVSPDTTLIP